MEERQFTTRQATEQDAETLSGLFNRAFNKSKTSQTASWKYFGSPHGRSLSLLAEGVGDGELESRPGGAYSYVFRKMTFHGKSFSGCQASDAMVDVEFRKRRIFTTLDHTCAEESGKNDFIVCMAVAGRQSMHGFLKNGWIEIGTYQTWVSVLDARALLGSRLPSPVAAVVSPLLSFGLGLLGRKPKLGGDSEGVHPVERFDERVDALWDEVKDRLPIAGVRDCAYLNWRFVETPTQRHQILIQEENDSLGGYLVYEQGGGRGYIVDILARDEETEDRLLREAMRRLRDDGNPMVFFSTLPCPRIRALLTRNGFFPHPRRRPFRTATPFIVRILRNDMDPTPSVLLDPGAWYILDGDRDVEHMSPA